MTLEESATPSKGSNDLTPETLYKFLVSMKSSIQTARTSIIRRHARLIVKLKEIIKKTSKKEGQKSLSATALKNKKKATKLKNEVKTLKNLKEHDIGKLVLLNKRDFKTAAKEGAGVSAICRMTEHKAIVEQKRRFNDVFGESVSQLPFCVKVLGAEKRAKKLRKLQAEKKGRMVEYDRRLCTLLKEIGGEEFAAAERFYVKVLNMKKSLEKRKKKERAWAKAQGPLGDRKAGYEEYLKTLKDGEEKESFASYVEKMDAQEENQESVSNLSDDCTDDDLLEDPDLPRKKKEIKKVREGKKESAYNSSDSRNDDASLEDSSFSDDESVDPKQLELRKKIFENLDAKFGEWDDENDSDISDIDDEEISPSGFESDSSSEPSAPSSRRNKLTTDKNEKKSVSSKSSLFDNRIENTKKRKRDEDDSQIKSSEKRKLTETSQGKATSLEPSRPADAEATVRSQDVEPSHDADPVDSKNQSASLFSLFKKASLTLAPKTPALPPAEKPKRKRVLDPNIKKSLYCGEEETLQSASVPTASKGSSATSFFQGDKEKNITPLNKLFTVNKKKIVSENEDELSEIPEAIAFEKAQKINRAGLAAECESDDEQEDLAGFNSTFLLKHEGQSLLQHMSLRGGKRSRFRGTDSRGRGMGSKRGNFGSRGSYDDEDSGGDAGFTGKKFGGAFFSRGADDTGKRGRGARKTPHHTASSRFKNDNEFLHPSWAAKKQNNGAIKEFQGKRTVFD